MDPDLPGWLAALPGVAAVAQRAQALWVEAPALDPPAMARAMAERGIRLAAITAIPQSPDGETTILYHYVTPALSINVRTRTRNNHLPSIAALARPASWSEREIRDLFGVEFDGHPNPVPLLRPAGFAAGMLRAAMCGPTAPVQSPTARTTP
jgi:NADH-quinone oxidoreductase subunit C